MLKVFVLILAVTGGASGVAESTKSFDTKEACEAYAPELVKIIEADLKQKGLDGELQVATWKCGTEAEFNGQKADK